MREHGYASLTIEGVSATAGVAKTTIYRRWASKAEMVFALVIHRTDQAPPIDTGSLTGDVRALAERAVTFVASSPGRSVLPGLLADMTGDAELATRMREEFVDAARDDVSAILNRALDRGELTTKPDSAGFYAALLGIPYVHVHLLADEDSNRLTDQLTTQLLSMLPLRP